MSASVTEDSRVPVTRWEYVISKTYGNVKSDSRIETFVKRNYVSWVRIPNSDDPSVIHTVTGLENGKKYFINMRAVNDIGNGPAISLTTNDSATPTTVPVKPTLTLTAPANRGKTLKLAAETTSNGGKDITLWEYRYATTTAALSSASWKTMTDQTGNSASFTVTGLSVGTKYYVEVRAKSATGYSIASDRKSITTAAKDSPFSGGNGSKNSPWVIGDIADFATAQDMTADASNRLGSGTWLVFTLSSPRNVTVRLSASGHNSTVNFFITQPINIRRAGGNIYTYESSDSITVNLAKGQAYVNIATGNLSSLTQMEIQITTAPSGTSGASGQSDGGKGVYAAWKDDADTWHCLAARDSERNNIAHGTWKSNSWTWDNAQDYIEEDLSFSTGEPSVPRAIRLSATTAFDGLPVPGNDIAPTAVEKKRTSLVVDVLAGNAKSAQRVFNWKSGNTARKADRSVRGANSERWLAKWKVWRKGAGAVAHALFRGFGYVDLGRSA